MKIDLTEREIALISFAIGVAHAGIFFDELPYAPTDAEINELIIKFGPVPGSYLEPL